MGILRKAGDLSSDDDEAMGRIFAIYAQYDRDNGDLESAQELSKRSLEYYERSGNRDSVAHSVRHLADIQCGLGMHVGAEENYLKALKLYRRNSETKPHDLANAVRPYGRLLKGLGRLEEARTLLSEAKALYERVGNEAGIDEMTSLLEDC